jgi:hypothetical protein
MSLLKIAKAYLNLIIILLLLFLTCHFIVHDKNYSTLAEIIEIRKINFILNYLDRIYD